MHEPTVAHEPAKSAFHNPAAWQYGEALDGVRAFADFDLELGPVVAFLVRTPIIHHNCLNLYTLFAQNPHSVTKYLWVIERSGVTLTKNLHSSQEYLWVIESSPTISRRHHHYLQISRLSGFSTEHLATFSSSSMKETPKDG
jgi:hypothetical protein